MLLSTLEVDRHLLMVVVVVVDTVATVVDTVAAVVVAATVPPPPASLVATEAAEEDTVTVVDTAATVVGMEATVVDSVVGTEGVWTWASVVMVGAASSPSAVPAAMESGAEMYTTSRRRAPPCACP